MPDYDVSALSLSTPPANASLTTYRPAISVKNNGLYPATATGTLSAYKAGLQVYSSSVVSESIAPGQTGNATADHDWTPPEQGDYMWFGYVTIIRDQVESNGYLAPVSIHVGPEPAPPTPGVTAHAGQHEAGGSDAIQVTNLHGLLADQQTPTSHKASHQVGGSDVLNVNGLPGILAEGQHIADHHGSHEDGGGDEMNVDGLHGQLYNVQKPDVHDNSAHDPNYATETALDKHLADTTAVHAVATNLEQTAHKGEPDGYAGLDSVGHVLDAQLASVPHPPPNAGDALTFGSGWARANALPHHESHEPGGDDVIAIAIAPTSIAKTAYHLPVGGSDAETVLLSQELPAAMACDNLAIKSVCSGSVQPGLGYFIVWLSQNGVHKQGIQVPCHATETTTFLVEFYTSFFPSSPHSATTGVRLTITRPIAGAVVSLGAPTSWYDRPANTFNESISVQPASFATTLFYPYENYQIATSGPAS
jgi:hypothetical protein